MTIRLVIGLIIYKNYWNEIMKMPPHLEKFMLHRHAGNEIAKKALKQIGIRTNRTLNQVVKAFTHQEVLATEMFWELIEKEHTGKFNGVEYCCGCKKFTLHQR